MYCFRFNPLSLNQFQPRRDIIQVYTILYTISIYVVAGMIDVVCIDSSSDEEPKSASKEKASPKVKSKSTAPLKPKLKEVTKAVTKKIKKPAVQ